MAKEFAAVAMDYCEAQGIGGVYATSGVALQDGLRRAPGDLPGSAPDTIALFRGTGGETIVGATPGPTSTSEDYALQVLVDSETVSGARATARAIYDLLHDVRASVISGVSVLWIHGVTPPQDLGTGPGSEERFLVTCNYTARLLR